MKLLHIILCLLVVKIEAVYYRDFMKDATKHLPANSLCISAINALIENMNRTTDLWAPRMLDASSKFPSSLFEWNLADMGNYHQCVNTKSKSGNFEGRFCQGYTNLFRFVPLRNDFDAILDKELIQSLLNNQLSLKANVASFALCVPSQCTEEDVNSITSEYTLNFKCETKEDLDLPLPAGTKLTLLFLGVLLLLMCLSTLYSLYCEQYGKEPLSETLFAFSVHINGKKLFRVSSNPSEITCLNGLRVYSSLWVILHHVFCNHGAGMFTLNSKDYYRFRKTIQAVPIISANLSIETFFCISGILLVSTFFNSMRRGNSFNLIKYYLHRYIRLTPVLASTILIVSNLLPYMGSGPNFKSYIEYQSDSCHKDWWKILLFFHDYDFAQPSCISHAWYLLCDFQLYLLSPLILVPLWKKPKLGIRITTVALIFSTICSFVVVYYYKLWPLANNTGAMITSFTFYKEYHVKTYVRCGSLAVGILFGYLLSLIKTKDIVVPKLNGVVKFLLWLSIFAMMLGCIYLPYYYLSGPEYHRVATALFIALHKIVWNICISFIIILCVTENGGIINWILSWPILQIINRLSFGIYILHPYLIGLITNTSITGYEFSLLKTVFELCGHTALSMLLSIFWALAFEMPAANLEKPIFSILGLGEKSKHKDK